MVAPWTARLLFLDLTAPSPKEVDVASEDAERSVAFGVGVAFDLEPGAFKSGAATFIEYEAIPEIFDVELGGQGVWGHQVASFPRT